jgi:hypothetical protein
MTIVYGLENKQNFRDNFSSRSITKMIRGDVASADLITVEGNLNLTRYCRAVVANLDEKSGAEGDFSLGSNQGVN